MLVWTFSHYFLRIRPMRGGFNDILLWIVLFASPIALAQNQGRVLVIAGQSGQVPVVEMNNRSYVDLENLARVANGSLSFHGNRIVLNLPGAHANEPALPPAPSPTDSSALSQGFMKAGIEAIAGMREWASPLAYAIQNSYQVTEGWVSNYRAQAIADLKLASAAATTDADRNALQLLNNEFDAVREWSDKLVKAKEQMDTAKYAVSPNALKDDPLSQKIVNCGHFLASMLGSGTFQDDSSCR